MLDKEVVMKKFVESMWAVVLIAGMSVVVAEAGQNSPNYRFDPVTQKSRELVFKNTWAGYKTFRNVCKSCHFRGNDKGAPFLYTESKSMKGWTRVFVEKYPKCARDGSWKGLSENELLQLNDYLFTNARDANNPFCSA